MYQETRTGIVQVGDKNIKKYSYGKAKSGSYAEWEKFPHAI